MIKVQTIIENVRVGQTNPVLVKCDDGNQYYMKVNNDVISNKTLFNELFANRLLTLLEISNANGCIGMLPQTLINQNKILQDIGAQSGICYLSMEMKGQAGFTEIIARSAINKKEFSAILLFDQLILNSDRGGNVGNWFYNRESKKMIPIDHTHIFKLGDIWEEKDLKDFMKIPPIQLETFGDMEYKILARIVSEQDNSFGYYKRLIKKIGKDEIIGILDEIPVEWNISETEKNAVLEFILFQIDHVAEIIDYLETKFHLKKKGVRK